MLQGMVFFTENHILLLLLCSTLFTGNVGEALSYDYSASIECVAEPGKALYGGGILVNPEFSDGTNGWMAFGNGDVEERSSKGGNKFIVILNRAHPYDSVSQKVDLEEGKLYTLSAWVQISQGSEEVRALFKTANSEYIHAGVVIAKSGCWSMLKGGLTPNISGPVELYFESEGTATEVWIDNVSLQPFMEEEWRDHQTQSIEKARKSKVRIHATDAEGKNLDLASVIITQTKPHFPFGSQISAPILTNGAYQNWFTSRFKYTTFGNEMKWYSTENSPGHEDYSVADAMVAFCKQHGISIRGHNIFWDDQQYQPYWVKNLSPEALREATTKRLNSVVKRYSGQLIAWDVNNENLHFSFFEDKLGENASAIFFQAAQKLDPTNTMFVNDYNTLETPADTAVSPAKYLEKLSAIRSFPGNSGLRLGIGLESHFSQPNIAYMRSALDTLGATNLPIWLTEVDVKPIPNQTQYFEQILREGYAHPAVQGIIMWTGRDSHGCYRMCLTDENFKNLPTGDVVDKLIAEWTSGRLEGTTDSNGHLEISVFYGEYNVTVINPRTNSSCSQNLMVTKELEGENELIKLQFRA